MAYYAPAANELTTSETSGLPLSQYNDHVFVPYRKHIQERIASNPGIQKTMQAIFRSNWRSAPGSTTRRQKGCAICKSSKLENFTFKPAELNFGPVPMDSLYTRSKGGGGLQGGAAVISDGVMRVLNLLQLEDRLPIQFWPSLDRSAAFTPPGYRGYKLSFSSPEESSAYREPFKGCEWAAVAFCCYKSPQAVDARAEKCPASIIIGKRWVDGADTLFVELHGRCQHAESATYGPCSLYHHTPAKADSLPEPNSPTESETLSDADSNDVCEAADCSPQRGLHNVTNWISSFLYDIPTDAVQLVLQLALRAGGRPGHQSAQEARPSDVIAAVQRLNASQLQSFCRGVLFVMSKPDAAPCPISHTPAAQNGPATARSVTQIEPAWPRKRKDASPVEASSSGKQPLPMQPPGRYPKLSRSQCEVCSLPLSRDCSTGLCDMCCKGPCAGHGRLDLPFPAPATMLGPSTDAVLTRNALDPVLARRGLQQGQGPAAVPSSLAALLPGASVQHQQLQGMAPDHNAFVGLPGVGLQLMRQGIAVGQTTHNALLLPGASLQRQHGNMAGHNPMAAPPLGGNLQPGLSATFDEYAFATARLAGSWQQVQGAPAGLNTLAVLLPGVGLQHRQDIAPGQVTLGAALPGGGYQQGHDTTARPNTFAAVLTRGGWQQEQRGSAHNYPTAGLLPGSGWQLGQHVPAAQNALHVMLHGNIQRHGQGLPAAGYNQMASAVSGGGWQQQHQVHGITAVHSARAVSIPGGGYLQGQGGVLMSGGGRGIPALPANGWQHVQQDAVAVESALAAALSGGRLQQGHGGMAALNLAATPTLPTGGLQQGQGVRADWNSLAALLPGTCLPQCQHVVPRQITLGAALSGGVYHQGPGAMETSNQMAAGLLSGGGWRGPGL